MLVGVGVGLLSGLDVTVGVGVVVDVFVGVIVGVTVGVLVGVVWCGNPQSLLANETPHIAPTAQPWNNQLSVSGELIVSKLL